jgi:hypothetical protein
MNRNLVGSIYGQFSVKIAEFVLIRYQTWSLQATLVSDWLIFKILLLRNRLAIFKNRPIRNKNCLWWPCLLMDRDKMSNLNKGPSIDASYQVSVHLAKRLQKRRMFKISIVCFIKKLFFCGKGDNSNLNLDISKIQLAMN